MAVRNVSRKSMFAALRTKLRMQRDAELRERYNNAPVVWIEERAKGFMWSIPRKIAQSLVDHRRTAVKACHGVGKSWLTARLATWWIDSHPPGTAFVVTTAPSAKQVKAVLWKEIRRSWVSANLAGRLNQTEWYLNEEMVAMGRKPSDYDPTAFQGIHAKYCLVLIDEGCGVPEQIYIAANSLASNEFSRIVVIGNPDDPDSHFKKICDPGSGWNVITISAFDTPNFTGEEVPQDVKDVLVSHIYVDEMKHDVGEDSPVYVSKVLGQFPENKADGVIPLSWIRQCQDEDEYDARLPSQCYPIEVGMDVGAGGDETSLRVRFGKFVGEFVEAKTPSALESYALAIPFLMKHKASRIKIDAIGVGHGLVGLIQLAQYRSIEGTNGRPGYYDDYLGMYVDLSFMDVDGVVPVNVGVRATEPELFPRLRDQMWWQLGRIPSQDRTWNLFGLDEKTVGELVRPTWIRDLSNKTKVESKQDTMKRTSQPSPNRADALLLAFLNPPGDDEEYIYIEEDPVTFGPDI